MSNLLPDDNLLGCEYSDSRKLVKKGDLVSVDNREGRVDEVCLAGSRQAYDYSCERTGGLLIQFDDGILALLPFGSYHQIIKRTEGEVAT